MPSWITALLTLLFGFFKQRGPSQATREAERAGAAVSALQTAEAHNAEVQQAAVAADNASRAVSDPSGLSRYAAADPNNRDNR